MRIKVCGMARPDNLQAVLALRPDYIGFIFYEKSPRFVGENLDADWLNNHFPPTTKKVGVFVNATPNAVLETARRYKLDFVQLHGDETPEYCRTLQRKGLNIIKAFRIGPDFVFSQLNNYIPYTDYFLFDAAGPAPGGNGVGFDWELLERYNSSKPFFLAGGLGPADADALLAWNAATGLRLHALDLNSRFEISPGLKNIHALQGFLQTLYAEKTTS